MCFINIIIQDLRTCIKITFGKYIFSIYFLAKTKNNIFFLLIIIYNSSLIVSRSSNLPYNIFLS
jgi:hypothetical protein